jgi:SM-20-related protein
MPAVGTTEDCMLRANAIEVHDGLVAPDLVNAVFESIHQPVYKFGQKSNAGDDFGFWIANISDETRASVAPLGALWETVERAITRGGCAIERMYVNAYSYGDCPTIHVDNLQAGHFTVLYYANYEWDANWSGETVFYNDARDEIIRAVYPKPGRIVSFDSRIPHVAREPNRICPVIRYTIAMKLYLKDREAARLSG